MTSDPDAAGLPHSPYDPEPVPERDLWFLPELDAEEPPPFRSRDRAGILDWRAAQGEWAAELAEVAGLFGALGERLRAAGEGARQRLALMEAAEISWQAGDRVTPDRLALWVGLRLAGAQADAQALARAAWAVRRLSGGRAPGLDPDALMLFLDRQEVPGQDEGALAGRLQDWCAAMRAAEGLHPIVQAAQGVFLWRMAGLAGGGPAGEIEAAVTAARLAAGDPRDGAPFLPLALAGPGALRPGGDLSERVGRWLGAARASVLAALMHLDRLAAWQARAGALADREKGRTPALLIAVLAGWPLVSAPLAETRTGASRAAVQRNLDRLVARGLVREVTGQGRYRMWSVAI